MFVTDINQDLDLEAKRFVGKDIDLAKSMISAFKKVKMATEQRLSDCEFYAQQVEPVLLKIWHLAIQTNLRDSNT
jgi:hypothetical protein